MALGRRPPRQGELFIYAGEAPPSRAAVKLRAIEALLDLDWLPEAVGGYFAADGRPSVDPRVVLKILWLQKLFGIDSLRETVDQCADRLSFREFLGYGGHEAMPDPSTLYKWVKRLGPAVTGQFVARTVSLAAAKGLATSGRRCVDATFLKAQASLDGPLAEVEREQLAVFLAGLLEPGTSDDGPPSGDGRGPCDGVLGPRSGPCEVVDEPPGSRPETVQVNLHDPQARLSRKGRRADFGYSVSYSSDPLSGLICDVVVKPLEEAWTLVEHVLREAGGVTEVTADSLYDEGAPLARLAQLGVVANVPRKARGARGGFGPEQFEYDAGRDVYRCPGGALLRPEGGAGAGGRRFYRAAAAACGACRLKPWCTAAKRRSVGREPQAAGREACRRNGSVYRARMGERRVSEHLNLLSKRDHGLGRADGLGLARVSLQAELTAAAININKILRWLAAGGPYRGARTAECRLGPAVGGWLGAT